VLALLPVPLGGNRDWAWPWWAAAVGALLAVLGAGAALGRWRVSQALAKARVVLALLVAFVVVGAVTGSVDRDGASRALLQDAAAVGTTLLVVWLADSRKRLVWLAVVLFAAGVAEAVYGSFMVLSGVEWGFGGPKIAGRGWATGTFVNRNHLAGFIELTAALGIGLLVAQLGGAREEGLRGHLRGAVRILLGPKVWLRGLLVAMVIALVLSQSRMGNVAFFVSMFVVGGAALVLIRPLPRMLLLLLVSILVVDLVVIGSWFGVEKVAQRLSETTVSPEEITQQHSTDAERYFVARATLAMARERPLLGFGAGSFRAAFPSFKPEPVALFYDHAHDDWVELLAERGAIGALLWTGALIGAFLAGLASMRRRHDPWLRGLGFGAAMGLLALSIHAFVDFNLQIPANTAYFQALMGVGLASLWLADGRSKKRRARSENGEPSSEAE
jgi:O-antigen ligase